MNYRRQIALIIAKYMTFFHLFQWVDPVQPIIQVLMIIVSCLLAWGEAWFLDCRVIPQEKNAQRFYRLFMVIICFTFNYQYYRVWMRIIIAIVPLNNVINTKFPLSLVQATWYGLLNLMFYISNFTFRIWFCHRHKPTTMSVHHCWNPSWIITRQRRRTQLAALRIFIRPLNRCTTVIWTMTKWAKMSYSKIKVLLMFKPHMS